MSANNLAYELIINKSSPFSKNFQVSDLDEKSVTHQRTRLLINLSANSHLILITHLLPPDKTSKNASNFSKIKEGTLRSKQ
jgi:hypothetical protein